MALPDLTKDWAAALSQHITGRTARPPPADWLTTRQIAKLLKISPTWASRNLSEMIRAGVVETQKFSKEIKVRPENPLGVSGPRRPYSRLMPYFRIKKQKHKTP